MARIRYVKPELFLDEELGALSGDHLALFVGLWTQADRDGRLERRTVRIKAALFPYRDVDVEALLKDLERVGKVQTYEADGVRVISIPGFARHQRPHPHEPQSSLPPPPSRDMSRPEMTSSDEVRKKGREEKGKEEKSTGGEEAFELEAPKAAKERKLSLQEKFATWFQEERKAALGDAWTEDRSLSAKRLNVELGWLSGADDVDVAKAVEIYLADPYRLSQDPPCSLLWFAKDRADYLSRARRGGAA